MKCKNICLNIYTVYITSIRTMSKVPTTLLTAEQSLTARRLAGEIRQLERNREPYYQVVQDEKNPFLFYFCYHNTDTKSPYCGGYYIGKIDLPNDYPKNPGNFYMLTPSGRFDVNAKICLTNS